MSKKSTASVIDNRKFTNEILEDHGDWLLVDISTKKYPNATMAVDTDVFLAHDGGRIYARSSAPYGKYIYAIYGLRGNSHKKRFLHKDVIDSGELMVDHIIHGTMKFVDNRSLNLRVVNHQQNAMNSGIRSDNLSGMRGVHYHKPYSCWRAEVTLDGKHIHLGYFDNIEIAIGVRQQAEREYFGEFAFKEAE